MTFKGKPVRIILTETARSTIEILEKQVSEEISQGITTSDRQTLLRAVKQKIEFLRNNPEYGIHIPKDRIPKKYISAYEVNNLWKVNLSGGWRLIYTIRGSEVEILSLILDVRDHTDYEQKFGYRKA